MDEPIRRLLTIVQVYLKPPSVSLRDADDHESMEVALICIFFLGFKQISLGHLFFLEPKIFIKRSVPGPGATC